MSPRFVWPPQQPLLMDYLPPTKRRNSRIHKKKGPKG